MGVDRSIVLRNFGSREICIISVAISLKFAVVGIVRHDCEVV